MKKNIISLLAVTVMLCSCTTVYQSATEQAIPNGLHYDVKAKVNVSKQKISYTYYTDRSVRRGGVKNCINMAIHEALKKHGNADVLVQSEATVIKRKGFFGTKVKSVTVTGFPATFTEFENK